MTAVIHWFRQDLRLSDNPAFSQATSQGIVLPVYILEDDNPMGAASRWWLHHSLRSLQDVSRPNSLSLSRRSLGYFDRPDTTVSGTDRLLDTML